MDINELRDGIDDFTLAMILGNTSENAHKVYKQTLKFSFDKMDSDLRLLQVNKSEIMKAFERLRSFITQSANYEKDIRETLGIDLLADGVTVEDIYAKLAAVNEEDKMMLQDDAARIDEIICIIKDVLDLMKAIDKSVKLMNKLRKLSEDVIA